MNIMNNDKRLESNVEYCQNYSVPYCIGAMNETRMRCWLSERD